MNRAESWSIDLPDLHLDVVEPGVRARRGAEVCQLEEDIKFDTGLLESFCSKNWQPVVYDALLLAAVVEYADRIAHRPASKWGRRYFIRVPVHEPERWGGAKVTASLVECLNFLTGDDWRFEFHGRNAAAPSPHQSRFEFPVDVDAVIPFSNGLDSLAVSGISERVRGKPVFRVRLGSRGRTRNRQQSNDIFAAVPYSVCVTGNNRESSARSRGFRFSLVAAVSAHLLGAGTVIVPESGQGALAPALIVVGQGYPDYRSHPAFTKKMSEFVGALFGKPLAFEFPRLWSTKGETLSEYVKHGTPGSTDWRETRSCWQQSRQASVDGVWRQCGVCAACLLRRMSIHSAGLEDDPSCYVWEDLSAASFWAGATTAFPAGLRTDALRQYAIAGVLHLDHFAELHGQNEFAQTKRLAHHEIAQALARPRTEIETEFEALLGRHQREWVAFVDHLGQNSFLRQWMGQ